MKFGIISTAAIATDWMIPAIAKTDHEVVAISSRTEARANEVAEQFDIPRAYGSYEAMFDDDAIDAVYNALPNSMHAEWTRRAADAGLDIFCEKPLTVDAAEGEELFDYCEDADVALMEAFMYQFHPRTERLREIVAEELEDVRYATATFSWRMPDGTEDVRLEPDLAGGALMDVGCYCVSGLRGVLGEPDRVYAEADDNRDCGVETQLVGTLAYDDGPTANLACGFDMATQQRIRIDGANGWVEATECFNPGLDEVSLRYRIDGREATETFDSVDQYALEAEAFADAVESGSPMPVSREESVANMTAIDAFYESVDRVAPVELE